MWIYFDAHESLNMYCVYVRLSIAIRASVFMGNTVYDRNTVQHIRTACSLGRVENRLSPPIEIVYSSRVQLCPVI
jgi:hypothetical protein